MKVIADLHLRSRYSRATSEAVTFGNIAYFAAIEGLDMVRDGTRWLLGVWVCGLCHTACETADFLLSAAKLDLDRVPNVKPAKKRQGYARRYIKLRLKSRRTSACAPPRALLPWASRSRKSKEFFMQRNYDVIFSKIL